MRLIDANALPVKFWFGRFFGVAEIDIVNAPTVDAEPVKHGHWISEKYPLCSCSVCGAIENADWEMIQCDAEYCPHCGAKMDEVKDEIG